MGMGLFVSLNDSKGTPHRYSGGHWREDWAFLFRYIDRVGGQNLGSSPS
jgi:hypothetical protein